MKTRDTLAMDPPTTTTFRHRPGVYLSRTTIIVITAIVLCCLVGTGFLVYHFLQCHNNPSAYNSLEDHQHNSHHQQQHPNDKSPQEINDELVAAEKEARLPEVVDLFLPKSIIPLQYDLKFIPFLDVTNFTFNGVAKIRIKVLESCKNITFHARALRIDKDTLNVRLALDQSVVEVVTQIIDEPRQFYILELDEELKVNEIYEINIKFKGMLNDDLEGFYRSKYEVGNETR